MDWHLGCIFFPADEKNNLMFALGYLGAAMWSGSHWSFGRWMLVCPLPLDMSGPKFLVQGLFWKVEWPSSWHPHEPLSFSSQKELGSGGRRNYYHGAKKDSYLDETLQMQLVSEEIWRDLQAPTLQVSELSLLQLATEVKRYLKTWFAIWQHMLQWNSSIPFYQVLQFEKTWPEVVDLVVLVPDWAWHSGVGVWYFMASMAFHGNLFDGPRSSQS